MRSSLKPIIFIGILLLVALFFIGFRIGKHVERLDKSYIPMPTPTLVTTISPTPATQSSFEFERIQVESCNVSFVLPTYLERIASGPDESEFVSGETRVFVSCDQPFVQQQLSLLEENQADDADSSNGSSATSTASASVAKTPQVFSTDSSLIMIQRNSDRKLVLIEMSQNIAALIQETVLLE